LKLNCPNCTHTEKAFSKKKKKKKERKKEKKRKKIKERSLPQILSPT